MQQHVRFLVIEDQLAWSRAISDEVKEYFEGVCGLYKARIVPGTAYDGDQGIERLEEDSFDLVTLDMNLGEGSSKSKISGLDILGEIAAENRAFFVIIITGAVTDPDLERIYGSEAAALMRYGAMNEAVRQLPAERVRILHKPDLPNIDEAVGQLLPHLRSALDQYRSVSRERNIFRPLPGSHRLWEIRYNGGPRLIVPAAAPYEMIRSALSQPNRALKVIQLVQAIAQSSGKVGAIQVTEKRGAVARHRTEDTTGIDHDDVLAMDTPDHFPVDTKEGTVSLEILIGGLLMSRRKNMDLQSVIDRFVEQFGEGPLLRLPGKIKYYAGCPQKSEEEFQLDDASRSLNELARELDPIVAQLRVRLAMQKMSTAAARGKRKTRVAIGRDSKELELGRAHWGRALAQFKKHKQLASFMIHLETHMQRGDAAKGHIHYTAPKESKSSYLPFWLTE